ncbi:tyrosine-type recombinase/integrase [Vibrio cyclitrophicus]
MSGYEYNTLKKGLSIYKQKGSKNYYLRMRIHDNTGKGSEFVKTLSTPDREEATEAAWGLFFSYKNKVTPDFFVSSSSSLISTLAEELNVSFDASSKKIYQDYKRVLNNEIVKDYGKLSIKDFDRASIKSYLTKYAKSTTQLRIRKTTIKHLFDLAIDKRFIKEYQIPSIPKVEVQSDEVRAMFAKRHLETLNKNFEQFIETSTNRKVRSRRELFRHYFAFLLETGIRPGKEALSLKWSDIYYDNDVLSIRISKGKIHSKSKTSFREIPLSSVAVDALSDILEHCLGMGVFSRLPMLIPNLNNLPKGFIFLRSDAQSTNPQYEKVFDQFCDFCSIDKDEFFYTLYSCRHTYITKQLVKGVDAYLVATQCGTSVEMIQKHYSKLTAVMRSSELVGDVDYNAAF